MATDGLITIPSSDNVKATLDRYAARVDAVLAQRTRLRGPPPIVH